MVQLVETWTLPNGKTRLRYRVAYDPPRVFVPLAPPVEWLFERWFRVSLRGLARLLHEEPLNHPSSRACRWLP